MTRTKLTTVHTTYHHGAEDSHLSATTHGVALDLYSEGQFQFARCSPTLLGQTAVCLPLEVELTITERGLCATEVAS